MKKGDWIKCRGGEEVKQMLAGLSEKGYGAVAAPGYYIHITQEPKEDRLYGKKEELPQDG